MIFLLALVFLASISSCSSADQDENDYSGFECQEKADCLDQAQDAAVAENMDCRYLEVEQQNVCGECFSDAECPDYHVCGPGGFTCHYSPRLVDVTCEVDEDCAAAVQSPLFEFKDQVTCQDIAGVRMCASCLVDADCPGVYRCRKVERRVRLGSNYCYLPAGA